MIAEVLASQELDQPPLIAVETLEQSIERLWSTSKLELVDPMNDPDFSYFNYAQNADGNRWMRVWSQPDDSRRIDLGSVEDTYLFTDLKQAAANDRNLLESLSKRARWWETSYKNLSEKVADGVKERIVVEDQTHSLELFNLHESTLTDKEVQDFEHAMEAVVKLSQGKAMSRIKGIVVLGKESFPEGVAGSFGSSNRILVINLDAMRDDQHYQDDHPEASTRYHRFFRNKATPSVIEIIVTHELGHALDVHKTQEAVNLDLDVSSATVHLGTEVQGVSAFQNSFGWNLHHVERRDYDNSNTWKLDDAKASESGELPMTNYGTTTPGEDFAETFAIMALGGDMSTAPSRERLVHKTIEAIEGEYAVNDLKVSYYNGQTSEPITARLKPIYKAAAYTKP